MDAAQGEPGQGYEDESNRLLIHVGRTIWENVPPMLFMSTLLLIAAFPALFLATATSWAIAWPVLALPVGAAWAGVTAACGQLLNGNAVTAGRLLRLIRRHATSGIRIGLVPASVGAILLGSFEILGRAPDAGWIVVPLLLDLGIAIVVAIALIPAYTLAARGAGTGLEFWLLATGIAFRNPVPVLGTLTLFGAMIWAASAIGPAVLLALAPLALLNTAVAHDALDQAA